MKIHEFQAKRILGRYGVPVPLGEPANTPEQAFEAASRVPGPVWVVKSQIHAGGRGKGRFKGEVGDDVLALVLAGADGLPGKGGVRLAKSPDEVAAHADAMLGHMLVTKQTGAAGVTVRRIYVEQGCSIARELYLACLLDRARQQVVLMASTEGGTEIEEVAARHPEKILKVWIDPMVGLGAWQSKQLAFGLGLEGKTIGAFSKLAEGVYRALLGSDASLVEINPLVVTEGGDVLAIDGKMTLDDSGLFRHKELAELRDVGEEDPAELAAAAHDLNYIRLDGNIGCMVNGAGLAMATMDIIKLFGGEPANFLDVGGGADKARVTEGFKIITRDPKVQGILVNIFGGIMKCDVIAEGVLAAVEEVGLKVPLVVRLEGTNVDIGKRILAESTLDVIAADSMADAAQKVVRAAAAYAETRAS
jgi:succinyl-CoA synthetase beta subunit